jgi:hypothetical protein
MKNSVAEQASPALNRGVITGPPISSGNSNEMASAAAKRFTDDLRRRATHPLREPDGYRAAIADCLCEAASAVHRKPSPYQLSLFEWNQQLLAAIVVVLLVLSTFVWAGCRATSAALAAVGDHTTAISRALSE